MGALDMGGASTQITFVPGGPIRDESTQASFRLYGFEHRVYTHSYLCFGRDQMLIRLLARLVQVGSRGGGGPEGGPAPGWCSWPSSAPLQSSPAPRVRHPCYHSGYVGSLSLAPLYESPCVQAAPPPDFPPSLPVEGTGNPEACVSALRELFNFPSCHGREDCAFNGVYQPPVRGQFYVSAQVPAPGPGARWARLSPGQADRRAPGDWVWGRGHLACPATPHCRHPHLLPLPTRPSLTSTTPSTS